MSLFSPCRPLPRRQFLRLVAALPVAAALPALAGGCFSPAATPASTPTPAGSTASQGASAVATPTQPLPTRHTATPAARVGGHTVAVLKCSPKDSDRAIEDRLVAATGMVMNLAQTLEGKRKVYIKPNIGVGKLTQKEQGRLYAIVDPALLRATVAMLRRHYSGEIVIGEALTEPGATIDAVYKLGGYSDAVRDFDVRFVDLDRPPYADFPVPGGGVMFSCYSLSQELAGADFVVSLAKMKSHLCGGVTLTLKNLFGLPPLRLNGNPRRYLHQLVRLPRVLVDLGLIMRPSLCIVDALVGQNEKEWDGPPVVPGLLVVGDNTIGTDAVAARLMGHDPEGDYGQAPFFWDRNPLRIGVEAGLGSASASEIIVKGDQIDRQSLPKFYVGRGLSSQEDAARKSLADQARSYLAQRDGLLKQHQGKMVGLLDGKVVVTLESEAELGFGPGGKGDLLWSAQGAGLFLKRVVPADEDPERFEVYEGELVPPSQS